MKYLNKMIAPVIITILFIIYFVGIALSISAIKALPFLYKVLYVVIPFIMAIVMIVVLIGRIKEIRSGEEEILVNTDYINGKELEMIGLVKGSTIQSKNIGKDITQGFKTLIGGELKAYNEMMNEVRALATKRMVEEAESLGAEAVVNIRYASAAIMQGAAEVMAYGTAVKFK